MCEKCIEVCGLLMISTNRWITASHTSNTGNAADSLAKLSQLVTGRFVSEQSHLVAVAIGHRT